MTTVGYLRTYDFPRDEWAEDHSGEGTELPGWFAEFVATPFLLKRKPFVIDTPSRVCEIEGRTHDLHAMPIVFPHLRLIQIHFWFDDVEWADEVKEGLLPFPIRMAGATNEAAEHRAAGVADQIYWELTGTAVEHLGPRRTDLGALVFDSSTTGLPDFLASVGAFESCSIGAAGYDLQVRGRDAENEEIVGPVLVVAGVLGRARHLRKRLIEEVVELADAVQEGSFDPWNGVKRTAQLQAQYVTFRRELNGEGYLNRAKTKRLLSDLAPELQVPQAHLDDLDAAMASLDALSHSLLGLAIDNTQKRVGLYGLFFAGLSILFATFAVVEVAESPMEARLWVLFAVIVTAVVFLVLRMQVNRRHQTTQRVENSRRKLR